MKDNLLPWNWSYILNTPNGADGWLKPCEESWYYAHKWLSEGRKSLLDLGCGLGRHSVLFAKCGFKVTALDISNDGLDYLREWRKREGVDIACRQADMKNLPFANDAFDCVFAMHSIGHGDTNDIKRITAEIRRVLKPDGEVFLTLCSKETWFYADSNAPKVDENTVLKTEGAERGVPHFCADPKLIEELFCDFELRKVRMTDECFHDRKWQNKKHYFIEAAVRKEPYVPDYSDVLGKKVSCVIDRPLGSCHPRHPNIKYPINYGYIEGIKGGDGAWQDVYILGENKPLERFDGVVIGVYHRLNDNEDKWLVSSQRLDTVTDGRKYSGDEILEAIEFQEKYFEGKLYLL